MNNEIIEIAKLCGDDWDHTLQSDKDFIERFYREAQRRAFKKAAEVCEEHALMCDTYAEQNRGINVHAWRMWLDKKKAHEESARSIRSLIGEQ